MISTRDATDGPADNYRTPPELLISAVLHLISQYNMHNLATDACVQSARTIERHLRTLSDWPELAPVLRATCQQLSEQWATVVERSMPRPEKHNLFARLVSSARTN